MTFTWELFALLTGTAVTVLFHCDAERLPQPTSLSHNWLDPFAVNVSWSWKKPDNLPESCDIKFTYNQEGKDVRQTNWTYFKDSRNTEETDSSNWTYTILTETSCDGWTNSEPVNTVVRTPKPRAKMVKDFKCFYDPSGINCSWIPANRTLNLTLSYRMCGHSSEEVINHLKQCNGYYTFGVRDGCYLEVSNPTDICIHAATETAAITFKPLLVLHSPKLTVKQNEKSLNLNWQPPEVGQGCVWIYELCYTKCSEEKTCENITKHEKQIPYNENCRYEFQSRIITEMYCPSISSDFGDAVYYGINKSPDKTLTVVAFIIPIVLSVCVMLSCFCFRRHSHIIFPTIPDPRAIFKEMMNGNKELKSTPKRVYTPQPEFTESCTLVNKSCDLQKNP